jgi:hypothetical protein
MRGFDLRPAVGLSHDLLVAQQTSHDLFKDRFIRIDLLLSLFASPVKGLPTQTRTLPTLLDALSTTERTVWRHYAKLLITKTAFARILHRISKVAHFADESLSFSGFFGRHR